MIFDEFDSGIDDIAFDPRPRVKVAARNIIASEFSTGPRLNDDQRQRFAAGPLRELLASVKTSIESNDYRAIDRHLQDFSQALRNRLQYERTSGELKPVTVASEIERNREALRAHLYGGVPEASAIEALLRPNEKIIEIGWHSITTDRQTILRRDLPKVLRPSSFRDGDSWRRGFVSDSRVQEAMAEETRAQAPIMHQHGQPSRWIE